MQEIDDTIKLTASSLSYSASIPGKYDVEWEQLGLDQNEREAREIENQIRKVLDAVHPRSAEACRFHN